MTPEPPTIPDAEAWVGSFALTTVEIGAEAAGDGTVPPDRRDQLASYGWKMSVNSPSRIQGFQWVLAPAPGEPA